MSVDIKICGLSQPDMLEAALEAGAAYVGLVFYEPSPRNVTIAQAHALAEIARGRATIVALTVDAPDALLRDISRQVRPDFLQAHGSETPDRVREMTELTGLPVIKAIKIRESRDVGDARDYAGIAAMILFDARAPDALADALPGGNGIAFDWTLLQGENGGTPFMLSGGLDCSNIAEAIRVTGAPAVDVSSGVERAPGVKDADLIRKFIETARAAR
ncbi:MAG TPA: phosphoribosylanthranilate isomerase [Aestuariivirgaceae bacterium]|nr:phosphoribosylanthranilate isomerase [Aestuariivirgaceae bacterium]